MASAESGLLFRPADPDPWGVPRAAGTAPITLSFESTSLGYRGGRLQSGGTFSIHYKSLQFVSGFPLKWWIELFDKRLSDRPLDRLISNVEDSMSISLNTGTLGGMSTQDAQKMENIAKDFKKLESDLKSGDLSAAKQDYVTLKSDLPATSSTSSTGSSQTNPMDQLLTQLGKDLDSGNISAAQQDFSQIKQQLQNGPQGPPPGAPSTSSNSDSSSSSTSSTGSTGESEIQKLLDQLEKNLKNGDTTSAKETLKTLQEDIANMASSYAQSSSTGSTVNTYA